MCCLNEGERQPSSIVFDGFAATWSRCAIIINSDVANFSIAFPPRLQAHSFLARYSVSAVYAISRPRIHPANRPAVPSCGRSSDNNETPLRTTSLFLGELIYCVLSHVQPPSDRLILRCQ